MRAAECSTHKKRKKTWRNEYIAPRCASLRLPRGGVAFRRISRFMISRKSGNVSMGVAWEHPQPHPWNAPFMQSAACKGAIFMRTGKVTQGGFPCPCKYGAVK